MTFTRRDFTRIATTIRLYRDQTSDLENATMVIDELVNRLCVDFGQIDGAFKPMLFRQACGIERSHTLDWLRNAKTEYPNDKEATMTVTTPSVFIEDVPTPTLVREIGTLKAGHYAWRVVANELRRRGVLDEHDRYYDEYGRSY